MYRWVVLTVEDMTSRKPAYDDPSTAAELVADCRETERNLAFTSVVHNALRPAPSIRFEDQPQGLAKQDIDMLAAAHRVAGALGLEMD